MNELEKVRWVNSIGNFSFSVDEFGRRLAGLILAEVDLGTTNSLPSAFLIDLNDEVTNDEHFIGGKLAMTTTQELVSILNSFHIAMEKVGFIDGFETISRTSD